MTVPGWCRRLQPNHFGVLALPVGEFLGLLHGAVYVGSHAVDGDLQRLPSARKCDERTSNQFFAQRADSHEKQVPLVTLAADTTVQKVRVDCCTLSILRQARKTR
jgi:hypothetical protein